MTGFLVAEAWAEFDAGRLVCNAYDDIGKG